MAKWLYACLDNSGKRQAITVTAPDKFTAMDDNGMSDIYDDQIVKIE